MSTLLEELETAAADAATTVGAATVAIGRSGRGSGVVVAEGRVLTNAHNLRDRTTQVTFADGRAEQGSLLALDPGADLAVVEVDTGDVEPVRWADQVPGVGAVVLAVSRGHGGPRVTVGFVSGVQRSFRGPGRRIDGGLEHRRWPCSSGGLLVDLARLVGLNTHRLGEASTWHRRPSRSWCSASRRSSTDASRVAPSWHRGRARRRGAQAAPLGRARRAGRRARAERGRRVARSCGGPACR
jgi:S1-C subfamily serine protease